MRVVIIAEAPEEPGNRALSDLNRELSRIYNGLPKVVVTDRTLPLEGNPWEDTSRTVAF